MSDAGDGDVRLMLGDCLAILPSIPDQSIDAILCDPPYPMIRRPYGMMTEADWHAMMRVVVAESRRVLKPSGSAVFILQPNSEKVGRMRPWLWEFMAWTTREWNMIQDVWWWNFTALPMTKNDSNALRSSVKACVWLGPSDCYRDVSGVRWSESDSSRASRLVKRSQGIRNSISGSRVNRDYDRMNAAVEKNGGVTPFNLVPIQNSDRWRGGGVFGHGASTPEPLCDWWVRYISPPTGVVCDPFMGSGTVGLAALKRGRRFIGVERDAGYFKVAESRIVAQQGSMSLLTGPPA